jgi:hypothetical protein
MAAGERGVETAFLWVKHTRCVPGTGKLRFESGIEIIEHLEMSKILSYLSLKLSYVFRRKNNENCTTSRALSIKEVVLFLFLSLEIY